MRSSVTNKKKKKKIILHPHDIFCINVEIIHIKKKHQFSRKDALKTKLLNIYLKKRNKQHPLYTVTKI